MKTITEDQAQQLANILGMTIAVDRDETVCGFTSMPYKHMDDFQWNPNDNKGEREVRNFIQYLVWNICIVGAFAYSSIHYLEWPLLITKSFFAFEAIVSLLALFFIKQMRDKLSKLNWYKAIGEPLFIWLAISLNEKTVAVFMFITLMCGIYIRLDKQK